MRRKICWLWVCAILVASGHSQSGSDQNPTRVIKAEIQPPVNIRSTVDLVLADTLVLDRIKGTPVGGLTVDDFVLYENGVGQQISYFSQDQLPLSLLLLVDRGGCLDPFNDQVREAIRAILRGLKPQDRIGLMAFSDHPKLVLGLTSNQSAVADALGRMPKHESFGGHCFNRALTEAAQYLRDSSKSDARRLIVVITAQRTGLCNSGPSARDVSRMLMESSVMVFGILPRTPAQQLESGMYGVATSLRGALRIGSLVNLSRIAQETGGEIFNDPPEELAHSFAELTLHLRTRYTLGFVPSNRRRDGGFRKLKVQLSAPGETRAGKVRIQARRGYFAPREEAVTMNGR